MPLKQDVSGWDGKSKDDIAVIYERYRKSSQFIANLVNLLAEPTCQLGASWLLKKALENGLTLSENLTGQIFTCLNDLAAWQSRLHLLQCIQFLQIPKKYKKIFEGFLRENIQHQNKFVRAWSYDGFCRLAMQFPEYQNEVAHILSSGMRDEPASVKARIRNVKKECGC